MKTYKDYYTGHMSEFERFECIGGSPTLNILNSAIGMEWSDIVLGALHAYNPSSIRVVGYDKQERGMTCDYRDRRITVIVDSNNIIHNIFQEVHVGIPPNEDQNYEDDWNAIKKLIRDCT